MRRRWLRTVELRVHLTNWRIQLLIGVAAIGLVLIWPLTPALSSTDQRLARIVCVLIAAVGSSTIALLGRNLRPIVWTSIAIVSGVAALAASTRISTPASVASSMTAVSRPSLDANHTRGPARRRRQAKYLTRACLCLESRSVGLSGTSITRLREAYGTRNQAGL